MEQNKVYLLVYEQPHEHDNDDPSGIQSHDVGWSRMGRLLSIDDDAIAGLAADLFLGQGAIVVEGETCRRKGLVLLRMEIEVLKSWQTDPAEIDIKIPLHYFFGEDNAITVREEAINEVAKG